jgi:hypothetical protein
MSGWSNLSQQRYAQENPFQIEHQAEGMAGKGRSTVHGRERETVSALLM